VREIKFRAWVKNGLPFGKSGLREVSSISFNHCVYVVIDEKDSPGKDQNYWQVMKEDYILLQYTGLKDKNEKNEIYEGDIFDYRGQKVIIEYVGDMFHCKSTKYPNLSDGNYRLDTLRRECEVIGNIYENKELLEGK